MVGTPQATRRTALVAEVSQWDGSVPGWPDEARHPRILVEAPLVARHWTIEEAQRISDCAVAYCGGPAMLGGIRCPLVTGAGCPLAAGADVVVGGLSLDGDGGRQVLGALRERHPETPVVVLAWQADVERRPEILDDCEVVVFPWTRRKIVAAVQSVLGVHAAE